MPGPIQPGEHPPHTGPGGYWTAAGGHCACGDPDSHGAHQCEQVGNVVLRCRCGDPNSHAGEHCPQAEVHPLPALVPGA